MKHLQYIFIILTLTIQSCGGGDDAAGPNPNPNPGTDLSLGDFELIFPINNTICTEGTEVSETTTSIPFRWSVSENATSYKIEVINSSNGDKTENTATTNSTNIDLPKGTQFTWNVIAILDSDSKPSKENWNFYSEGITVSNHVPFPAKITLQDNKDGSINVSWTSTDLDNDIDMYEVFLQEGTNRTLIAETKETVINGVRISYDTIYSLEVITKDKQGNSSSSKREFRFKN